jgi:hypothetical protein
MVFERLGDPFYQAEALFWLALEVPPISPEQQQLLQQCLDLLRAIGDRNGIAWITLTLADTMLTQLDYLAYEHSAREALALMREIRSVKGVLEALFILAQATLLKGALEEALALIEHMCKLANETNNLSGAQLSADLLAFVLCVLDESYTEAAALAERSRMMMSQEQFFGSQYHLGKHWWTAGRGSQQPPGGVTGSSFGSDLTTPVRRRSAWHLKRSHELMRGC